MLPVLPRLAGLVGNAVARGAVASGRTIGRGIANAGRTATRAGRTATRRINTAITNATNSANVSGGNSGDSGDSGNGTGLDTSNLNEVTQLLQQVVDKLNEVTQLLQQVVDKLNEATTQTQQLQTNSSKLSKIWHGMGNILNKVLVTPLKKALGFLVKMLKTARNLVMAFGAMVLTAGFSYNNNGKEARRGRISNKNLEAYNRAKALQGISEDELNLGQLQSYIGSHEGYKLAYFGINREEIAKKSGLEAMEYYRQKVGEWLSKQNPNSPIDPTALSIIQASSNVNVANDEGKRIFTDSTWGDMMKDYKMFVKQIPDTSVLGKAQRSIALLKFKFKDFLAHIAVAFAPLINGVLDNIIEWTNKVDLAKIAEFLSPIVNASTNFMQFVVESVSNFNSLNTLSKTFTGSNNNSFVESIVKIGSALADIASEILPYFLQGLNVLSVILTDLANFLKDPQAWWDKTKGTLQQMHEDDKINASIYGKRGKGWTNLIGVADLMSLIAPETYAHLDSYNNNYKTSISKVYNETTQKHEVVIKVIDENGKTIQNVSQVIGGGQ